MTEPVLPKDQEECDSCRFPTRDLVWTPNRARWNDHEPEGYWFCLVCRMTMTSSVLLYPNQWDHQHGEIIRTIAFGINVSRFGLGGRK